MLVVAAVAAAVLGFVWVGYPAIMAVLAALWPRRPAVAPPAGPPPTVSVIVASADPAADVEARVRDLLATEHDAARLEVIVAIDPVNGRATPDELRDVDPRLRVVIGDQPGGKAAALNAGVRAATGELLAFTDTHQRFEPTTIPRLVAALRSDARLGAVSGALALSGGRGARTPAEWYWLMERRLRRDEARVHSVVGVTGAVYAMRRALWRPLPSGLLLDDLYVPMRLVLDGHRVGFEPTARAVDARTFGARQEFRRKVRTLTGNLQLCAWLPAVLVPGRNPIWLQLVCHKLLRLLTPYLLLVLVGAIGLWTIGALWRTGGIVTIAALAAPPLLMLLHPASRRRLVRPLEWVVLLPAAAFVATVNGVRGRWTVWQR